ncbi:HAD family hydrolase [Hymenobacter arizonensis]|uniref:phosphoglycolate phosphatase n=1 Tax=Hymenobacter arizonensis TaxID=1227077 RepID=A0A1I5Z662_HYMAR|nr:HAD family hydrolase [Hymenobacter arizonensis]SFQ51959.1 phosphoglycolate phosphatase [Hymenobacter arizonensis]
MSLHPHKEAEFTISAASAVRWPEVKAVIFDVDGTLYTQSKLRSKMLVSLLGYYALRPWRLDEMLILQRFRAEREKRHGAAGPDIENAQYAWASNNGRTPVDKIKRVVEHWMFQYPNQYLRGCTYPGTHAFFATLRQKGIKIGIYSDYKAHDKMAAMGLAADIIVSSTDPEIDHLKPAPHGLLYIADALGLAPADCLFIGDRPELDGACAEQAGMPYLIVDKQPFDSFTFYKTLEDTLATSLTTSPHE